MKTKGNPGFFHHKVKRYLKALEHDETNQKFVIRAYKELVYATLHHFGSMCTKRFPSMTLELSDNVCVDQILTQLLERFQHKPLDQPVVLDQDNNVEENLKCAPNVTQTSVNFADVNVIHEDFESIECWNIEKIETVEHTVVHALNNVTVSLPNVSDIEVIANMSCPAYNKMAMERISGLFDFNDMSNDEFGSSLITRKTDPPYSSKSSPSYYRWKYYISNASHTQQLAQLCYYDQRLIRKIPLEQLRDVYYCGINSFPFLDHDGFYDKIKARKDFPGYLDGPTTHGKSTGYDAMIEQSLIEQYGLTPTPTGKKKTKTSVSRTERRTSCRGKKKH